MSALYYLGLGVSSLSLAIYNMNIGSTGNNLTCYNVQQMNYTTYLEYNNSLNPNSTSSTSPSPEDETKMYDVPVKAANIFSIILFIIGIVYLVLMGLSIILSCIVNSLSNQLPEDFLQIGKCRKFMACFCKILPPFFIILHWIIMILIVIVWILVAMKSCSVSKTTIPGELAKEDKFYNDVFTLSIVNICIWAFIHYGGAIVREMTYQEPFMYSPDIGNANACRSLLLKKLGP